MPQVLSIQSSVAYGFAGNSAACFTLRRGGIETWPVYTVHFSNHTGYGDWRGPVLDPSQVSDVVRGIDERGILGEVDAVLSGYQGAPTMGQAILDAVTLVRSRNPEAIYCCDPVMGDVDRGFYAAAGIPEFMRDRVTAEATVMTPNLFELEYLTDTHTSSLDDVITAAEALRARGPRIVLVTSAIGIGADDQVMRMIAQDSTQTWQVTTPLLDRKFTGSGDLTTAVFLTQLLNGAELPVALSHTASAVYSILARTDELGRDELALVQAQADIVDPVHRFEANKL